MLLGARQFFSRRKSTALYDAEVEYLEAAGDQWIDTGVVGNQNLTIDAYFSYRDQYATGAPFGSRITHLSRALAMTSFDSSATYDLYLNYNTSSGYVSYQGNDVYAHGWNVHVQNGNSRLYKDGTVVATNTNTVGSFTTPSTLFVLAMYNNGKISKANGIRIHSFRIESSVESERRDFIPVRKGSKGYMYDRVSGKLFGNQGTGNFVVGPDVVEVKYLESTGTQWIDTGLKASNSTAVKTRGAWKDVNFENALFAVDNGSTFNGGFNLECSPLKYIRFIRGAKYVDSSVRPTADTFYDLEVGPSGMKVNGTFAAIADTDAFTTTFNLSLFRWRRAPSSSWGVSAKIGQTKIYDGETLVRDFVPVRVGTKATSWEGAMMDKLTRKIYRNAGTGSFNYA